MQFAVLFSSKFVSFVTIASVCTKGFDMTGIGKLIHMRSFWTAVFTLAGIVAHEVFGSDIINAQTEGVFVATILALVGGGAVSDATEAHKGGSDG